MTNKVIKVDRVRSAAEAVAVEELGASLVGVALDPDPRFADERVVSLDLAGEIGKSLSRAKFVVELDFRAEPIDALRRAEALRPDLVQPITGTVPPADVRAALSRAGIGMVYAGIEIAHDDDPSWVLSRYADTPDLRADLFQVDVLPEYRNSWEFLRDEAPEFEDEFQVEDLNQLGRDHQLLATFNFTPHNVAEIVAALPALRGFALTLADHATRTDLHFLRDEAALAVLQALHRS
ncbi:MULTISPECIES: hypothetical protein [Micromonospora]|uniref:Phosphoribosylanthranilate isomerase n=1 Tax=Micromonospora solifontis TaxID=2487138 RepID=A0ABX9W9T4_9ACTN|nr:MULTISPECIES: hypothetical protein [Micromonospora]NES16878.1 hypothetical protein [Micromonospora sp. PPF5-17B]NES39185.1 hypothetical protein [Micromonospora solifontis]NES58924.1 hypothetical protein [Micromonospora sp. PPF5-6]RNL90333.1 hypothetical protein EFE23_24100 [Micromonospora solifontis]